MPQASERASSLLIPGTRDQNMVVRERDWDLYDLGPAFKVPGV